VFSKENGDISAFKTFLVMDEDRHRMLVDEYFSGYVALSDLDEKPIEMVLFDEGKLTYSSKNVSRNESKSAVNICLQYASLENSTGEYCAEVYKTDKSEYIGFLGSILEPHSRKTLNDKSFDKFIEHQTH
jgi:hypothetical protein